jgi:selenocysteine-specific elongation factor
MNRNATAAEPSPESRHIIIGTAGHIDHGKSSLVAALTGTHPDRLEEEKRRGITIDLGFAFLGRGGAQIGFVDVPGHERFVHNMLAGAGGVDAVLLVIAADESIKPQTREHFEICRLLGVKGGVIALTKTDLVDAEALGLAQLEAEEFVRGSFLEGAPVIPVSAKTGDGILALENALFELARSASARSDADFFRLPVDRSFTIKGFGTVVTGTLVSGSITVGEEAELSPGGVRLRVRGIESQGRAQTRAVAGQRTALNLPGIEHAGIRRGMTLATPGKFRVTRRIDARIEWLASAPKLKSGAQVHFHAGTAETIATVQLFERKELQPGRTALAHVKLRDAVLLLPGDRFILRQFSPVTTTGGGTVLEALARRPLRRDTGRVKYLEAVETGEPASVLTAMLGRAAQVLSSEEIVARTGWREEQIAELASRLAREGVLKVVQTEPLLLAARIVFEAAEARLLATATRSHPRDALLPGMTRAELRQQMGARMHPAIFRAALESLAAQGKLMLAGDAVRLAGAEVKLQPAEEKALSAIAEAFRAAGLAAPAVKDVLGGLAIDSSRGERLLQMLVKQGVLVRVNPELTLYRDALSKLREALARYKQANGERISVPAFKELAGVSRKYAIPLLEYLDRQRVTKRAGDERVIL